MEQEIEQLQARLGWASSSVKSAYMRLFKRRCFQNVFREGVDAEKIVKRHIALLHKYNEAKDAAQVRFNPLISMDLWLLYWTFIDSHWKSKKRFPCFFVLSYSQRTWPKLASIKQTTIRQIHQDYGLTDNDWRNRQLLRTLLITFLLTCCKLCWQLEHQSFEMSVDLTALHTQNASGNKIYLKKSILRSY